MPFYTSLEGYRIQLTDNTSEDPVTLVVHFWLFLLPSMASDPIKNISWKNLSFLLSDLSDSQHSPCPTYLVLNMKLLRVRHESVTRDLTFSYMESHRASLDAEKNEKYSTSISCFGSSWVSWSSLYVREAVNESQVHSPSFEFFSRVLTREVSSSLR